MSNEYVRLAEWRRIAVSAFCCNANRTLGSLPDLRLTTYLEAYMYEREAPLNKESFVSE